MHSSKPSQGPGLKASRISLGRTPLPLPRSLRQASRRPQASCNDSQDSSPKPSRREILSYVGLMATAAADAPWPAHAALIEEDVAMRVFTASSPSVVSIVNYKTVGGVRAAEGVGTGVIWDRLGHVATNYHVISKVDKSTIGEVRILPCDIEFQESSEPSYCNL